jgi:sulfite exporter TauE/SafE
MPFAVLAGLAAGLVHVMSGPDHLVAVAPLAADEARPHWRAGFQWGLGHTAGVLVIGGLLLAFRELLPIDAISAYSERIVGLSLIAIGVWGAYRATRQHRHPHVHAHPPSPRLRLSDSVEVSPKRFARRRTRLRPTNASFAMGLLHGLAGGSHLFGVLPALALSSRMEAGAYLGGFGIGAIAAMTAFAAVVGLVARGVSRRGPGTHRGLLYACSTSAFLVGGFWLIA